MLDEIENEYVLPDNYPVYYSYFYICDGQVIRSPIQGDVSDLKRALKCLEVRRCDAVARKLL